MEPSNNEAVNYRMMAVDQLPEKPQLFTIYYVREEERGYLWDPQQDKYLPVFGPETPDFPLVEEEEDPVVRWIVPPAWVVTGVDTAVPPSPP